MKIKNKNRILKAEVLYFGFLLFIVLTVFACKNEELIAKQIVERAVKTHGGINNWNTIQQLSFDKKITLFNEDASIESDIEQFQVFKFKPQLFGKVEWEQNDNDIVIIYDNGKIEKHVNDTLITNKEELEKAKNSFFASQYVISQPFNLLNDNITLTNTGVETVNNSEAYAIKIGYPNDTKVSDVWIYYIDTKTFKVIANKVIRQDHTSLVENLTFITKYFLTFNGHRKSYRLNASGEKTYLRAEYFYSNYNIVK